MSNTGSEPIVVKKRSGQYEVVDVSKVEKVLSWATSGLSVDYKEIFNENSYAEFFYDGVETSKIQDMLANKAETKITENYDWTFCAARLTLQKILKEAHGNAPYKDQTDYYLHIKDYLNRVEAEGVKKLQHERMINHFDLEALNAAIKPENDLLFQYMGICTLADRYLLRNAKNEVIESPQHFFMRVAMGTALAEKKEIATEIAIQTYNEYTDLKLLSSTPTLFNSGTMFPQLSSCYVLYTKEDSLEGIYDTAKEIALCSKFSGGTANSITPIRAKGSKIKSTGGKSSGVVPYAKLFEQTVRSFDQGGKRPGVIALYLEPWHKDIISFLESIKPGGDERVSVRDINLATWNNDLFMNRVAENKEWTLFSPNDCPDLHEVYGEEFEKRYTEYEKRDDIEKTVVNAKDIWKAIVNCLFNNKGNGWPCFKDTINRRSMTRGYGVVHSSNLCTEITLRNSSDRTSVCNLASPNISRLKTKQEIERAFRVAVRTTDNAITEGFIPIESGKLFNDEDRPLGIGVMGYAEFLADLGIPYDSYEHIYAADKLFEFISYVVIDESCKLGKEKGNFPMFEKSQWALGELPIDTGYNKEIQDVLDGITYTHPFFENLVQDLDWESLRLRTSVNMRNSTLLAIAPTATIANIAGCTSCTELPKYNKYQKGNLSGNFVVVSSLYRKYAETNPRLVREAVSIDPFFIIASAAARQKWIDQAQSTNIWTSSFLKENGKIKASRLSNVYEQGFRFGLKTFYYLHSEAPDLKKADVVIEQPKEVEENNSVDAVPFCNMEEGCVVCQ